MYIPTAVSRREGLALQHWAKDKNVVEAGSLLGYSTIQLAQTANFVVSIDHHKGYQFWHNATYRQFRRNLEVAGVAQRVAAVMGDYSLLKHYPADFVFIDLDGTYKTTLSAIQVAQSEYIGVHDYGRTFCRGVAEAVENSGCLVAERVDSLIVLQRPYQRAGFSQKPL